jgi:hypothetical protein
MRTIVCKVLDLETLTPCDGTCQGCRQITGVEATQGDSGLFVYSHTPPTQTSIHFYLVDCTKILSPSDLVKKLDQFKLWPDDYVIVYFDEVHRLVKRGMDEILLKEVEERRALWFFSTAKPGELEDMFLHRLIKLDTHLPTVEEMENLLVCLCEEAKIRWEPEAIVRLIEKSNRIVGIALQALSMASVYPEEGLTLDLVENDWTPAFEVQVA